MRRKETPSQTHSSLLEYVENTKITSLRYRNIYQLTAMPKVKDIHIIDEAMWDEYEREFVRFPLANHLRRNPLPSIIPSNFIGPTYSSRESIYIIDMEKIKIFSEPRAILAREPIHKRNILHWITESFIPTQRIAFSVFSRQNQQGYLQISYSTGDESFSYGVSNTQGTSTSSFFGSKEPLKIGVLQAQSLQVGHGEGFIDLTQITNDSIALCQEIFSSLDENDISGLLTTQDDEGNTPLHLLVTRTVSDKKTPYTDLLAYLLDNIIAALPNEVKVKLLCTQNNSGNNILHLLTHHPEGHWDEIRNSFGNEAFVRANLQVNADHHRAFDPPSSIPPDLMPNFRELQPHIQQTEERKVDEEEDIKPTIQEPDFLMINLAGLKSLVTQQRTSISIDKFLESVHSPSDILVRLDDGSTIFGLVIANQSRELISYCAKHLLTSEQLHEFYQNNSHSVENNIANNPQISMAEWKDSYDSQTIAIQMFDYLSHRMNERWVKSDDFMTRKQTWLELLGAVHNQAILLPPPSSDFRGGKLKRSRYYQLHSRLYNLAQAMPVADRKVLFLDQFINYLLSKDITLLSESNKLLWEELSATLSLPSPLMSTNSPSSVSKLSTGTLMTSHHDATDEFMEVNPLLTAGIPTAQRLFQTPTVIHSVATHEHQIEEEEDEDEVPTEEGSAPPYTEMK